MQILNVSIDIDHVFQHCSWHKTGHVDDIDSFVEFFVEKITGNNSLFAEHKGEDRHSRHKLAAKAIDAFVFFRDSQELTKTPLGANTTTALFQRNSRFISNDYATIFSPPPEFS